jgi:Na+/H+ antiporter NhaC
MGDLTRVLDHSAALGSCTGVDMRVTAIFLRSGAGYLCATCVMRRTTRYRIALALKILKLPQFLLR